MDDHTARMQKIKFARVCVGVDANFRYPTSIPVRVGTRLGVVKASYKWKPQSCTKCLCFGHVLKNCNSVVVPNSAVVGVPISCAGLSRVNNRDQVNGDISFTPSVVVTHGGSSPSDKERGPELTTTPSRHRDLGAPVAVTRTSPVAHNTIFPGGLGNTNRFGVLAGLDDDNDVGENQNPMVGDSVSLIGDGLMRSDKLPVPELDGWRAEEQCDNAIEKKLWESPLLWRTFHCEKQIISRLVSTELRMPFKL